MLDQSYQVELIVAHNRFALLRNKVQPCLASRHRLEKRLLVESATVAVDFSQKLVHNSKCFRIPLLADPRCIVLFLHCILDQFNSPHYSAVDEVEVLHSIRVVSDPFHKVRVIFVRNLTIRLVKVS